MHEASLQSSRMYIKLPGIRPHEVCLYIWSSITETKEYCALTAISANRSTWLLQFHLECDFFFVPPLSVCTCEGNAYRDLCYYCWVMLQCWHCHLLTDNGIAACISYSFTFLQSDTFYNLPERYSHYVFFFVVVVPVRVLFSMFSFFPSFIQILPVRRCLFSHSLAIAAVGSSWISGVSYTNA